MLKYEIYIQIQKEKKYYIYYFKLFFFAQQLCRLISQVIIRREFNDKNKKQDHKNKQKLH